MRSERLMTDAVVADRSRERLVSTSVIDSEQILAQRFAQGDPDVIPQIVQRYSARLFQIMLRMTGSRPEAEDVLQSAWLRIIRNTARFDPDRPLSPWLVRIAVNTCRDHLRYERIRWIFRASPAVDDGEAAPVDFPDLRNRDCSDAMDVRKLLAQLSPKLRAVVVLKYYDGMTSDEIASVLEIPEGTVKSRLNLAMEKMRETIRKETGK